MSKVIIFPEGKLVQAEIYADACNQHFNDNIEPLPASFTYPPRIDAFGQWVTVYYGEIVNGLPFEEPSECLALRADGVLHESVIWPEEE